MEATVQDVFLDINFIKNITIFGISNLLHIKRENKDATQLNNT
jgi:hypothetical protein